MIWKVCQVSIVVDSGSRSLDISTSGAYPYPVLQAANNRTIYGKQGQGDAGYSADQETIWGNLEGGTQDLRTPRPNPKPQTPNTMENA